MPRKSPYSDIGDELEDVMGLLVEKLITVAMAEARHLVDEASLGLRTAAGIRR
jgi:hypothetical protein